MQAIAARDALSIVREARHAGQGGYEYERAGTCNICVAVEPRGERGIAQVTARRTKVDFVDFVCRMLRRGYSHAH